MPYKTTTFQVFIASPGDVPVERQLAREIIHEWNSVNSKTKKICLLPVGWEHDSSPEMGDRPQEFINKQVLKDSDLLIGIFWTRIGSQTGNSISGSVEEIEEFAKLEKPVMLYFSNVPVVPDSINQEQYSLLNRFKNECKEKGLVEFFSSHEDFRKKLTRQLSIKINKNDYFKIQEEDEPEILNQKKAKPDSILNRLSDQEKLLILEMSDDPNAIVMKVVTKSGYTVQANQKNLSKEYSPRSRAQWDEVFTSLLNMGLIQERGTKGQVFGLTSLGFQIADKLKD